MAKGHFVRRSNMEPPMSETARYDARTIMNHWIMAGLLAVTWLIPKLSGYLSQDMRGQARSVHIMIGVVLIVLLVARILWRSTGGRQLPPAELGLLGLASKAVHYGLYVLVAVTLALGVGYELMRGDLLFGLAKIPLLLPVDAAFRRATRGYHELAANGILILAGLHGAAALYHHFIRHDGVLRRMLRAA